MQVERYFHMRTGRQFGGATVRVTGRTEQVGQVDVQVALCSRKDPFCKKTGRNVASEAPVKVVPLRYLPKELARIQANLFAKQKVGMFMAADLDYTFALRYFLPKE